MIRYIASDLDGTLLQNGAQELNPGIFDLIRELKERNIRFIAASGRPYKNLRLLFDPVKDDISYIAENGSMCMHDGRMISRGDIDRDLIFRIMDAAREYGHCHTYVSTITTAYTDSTDDAFINHMRNVVRYELNVIEDPHRIDEPFVKIAICDSDGTEKLRPYFQERFGDEIKIVTSGNIWIDFIAPNANKGSALCGLLKHLGIDPADGIAFGDQYNDVEMLQTAGTSYAMANAAPGIAKYATDVTDSVEEVLRDLLRT